LRFAVTEANILKESNHYLVLKMHFAFQTPQNLCLVTDYCSGKDLSFLIASKICLDEEEARFYTAEIVIALNYLHNKGILYRDLKPENVLINHDGHIKLADFGLSKENVNDTDLSKTFCGSPACKI
jgi:serine/threonine protein kinase